MPKQTFMGVCEEIAKGAKVLREAITEDATPSFDRQNTHDACCLHIAYDIWKRTTEEDPTPPGLGGSAHWQAQSASPVADAIRSFFHGPHLQPVPLESFPVDMLEAVVEKFSGALAAAKAKAATEPAKDASSE